MPQGLSHPVKQESNSAPVWLPQALSLSGQIRDKLSALGSLPIRSNKRQSQRLFECLRLSPYPVNSKTNSAPVWLPKALSLSGQTRDKLSACLTQALFRQRPYKSHLQVIATICFSRPRVVYWPFKGVFMQLNTNSMYVCSNNLPKLLFTTGYPRTFERNFETCLLVVNVIKVCNQSRKRIYLLTFTYYIMSNHA